MTTTETVKPDASGNLILSAEDWLKADFTADESEVIIGTPQNPLVRPLTKNLVLKKKIPNGNMEITQPTDFTCSA